MTQSLANPLANGFSDFDSLPEATPDLPPVVEAKEDRTPETKECPGCGNVITREPGSRGRLPKYHPDCKPTTRERIIGSSTRAANARNTKAAAEADECIATFKAAMVKLAMGVAIVDRYDGFAVMAALPDACNNLRGVLIAHDSWRKDFLAIKSGGSIIGLIISGLMMLIPIIAHHGLVPSKRISELLVNLPITMFRIQQQMAKGEASLTSMLNDMANGVNPVQATRPAETPENGE
jgi:hypothetical protein